MSQNTDIEWCDATINFWHGCTKVSAACTHCYAETFDKRLLHDDKPHWGKGVPRMDRMEQAIAECFALNRKAERANKRLRVFVNSMSDWLDPEVPLVWLERMIGVLVSCKNLDFLLLTKRPEHWNHRLQSLLRPKLQFLNPAKEWLEGNAPSNIWLGVTIEDDKQHLRLAAFLGIPAAVRFLSCEPLLSRLTLNFAKINLHDDGIHWVICGGESGRNARPMNPDWARSLRDQCHDAQVPFFFKQWGEHNEQGRKVGKKKSGRLIDGEIHNNFPSL